jgi:hypothetical protein
VKARRFQTAAKACRASAVAEAFVAISKARPDSNKRPQSLPKSDPGSACAARLSLVSFDLPQKYGFPTAAKGDAHGGRVGEEPCSLGRLLSRN